MATGADFVKLRHRRDSSAFQNSEIRENREKGFWVDHKTKKCELWPDYVGKEPWFCEF
jgi:hypothetical protein